MAEAVFVEHVRDLDALGRIPSSVQHASWSTQHYLPFTLTLARAFFNVGVVQQLMPFVFLVLRGVMYGGVTLDSALIVPMWKLVRMC
eukprot:9439299-Karenia_brevis.AAC.1